MNELTDIAVGVALATVVAFYLWGRARARRRAYDDYVARHPLQQGERDE